jgi:hypothetical protein
VLDLPLQVSSVMASPRIPPDSSTCLHDCSTSVLLRSTWCGDREDHLGVCRLIAVGADRRSPFRYQTLSERLINRAGAAWAGGLVVSRSAQMPCAGPMIPMCDDQGDGARACPQYAPGWAGSQALSQ